jgi:hypothetical protein
LPYETFHKFWENYNSFPGGSGGCRWIRKGENMSISTRYLATKKKAFPFLKTLEKKTCSQMFLFYIAYFSKQNRDQMKEGNKKKNKDLA